MAHQKLVKQRPPSRKEKNYGGRLVPAFDEPIVSAHRKNLFARSITMESILIAVDDEVGGVRSHQVFSVRVWVRRMRRRPTAVEMAASAITTPAVKMAPAVE